MAARGEQAGGGAPFVQPRPFHAQVGELALTFYPDGADRLAALLDLIAGARETLKFVFYIYAMDRTGKAVRDALAEAARGGVTVTLILDGFGAVATDEFLAPLTDAGGRVLRFSPRWNVRYLIRNHQKIAIADDAAAIIGGFNIEDSYFDPPQANGWADLGIRVAGPEVLELARWFGMLESWTGDRHAQFLAIRRMVREWQPGSGASRWVVGGPTRWLSSWTRCVWRDIDRATRLDMLMAYFSPRAATVRRIGEVAGRARDGESWARLVLAGRSDNGATIGAARAHYGRLLKRGAQIWEFTGARLHTKLIVVDDVTYIGSANFDMRSLYLNLELMLRVKDAALAAQARALIAHHLPASVEVTPALHRKRRTVWTRIRWTLSWFLVTVVDYTVARRLNLGLQDPPG